MGSWCNNKKQTNYFLTEGVFMSCVTLQGEAKLLQEKFPLRTDFSHKNKPKQRPCRNKGTSNVISKNRIPTLDTMKSNS